MNDAQRMKSFALLMEEGNAIPPTRRSGLHCSMLSLAQRDFFPP